MRCCCRGPISICEYDENMLRLVYRVAGKGTEVLSHLQTGDSVELLGVLGNSYDPEAMRGKRIALMGGGIGIPPMLALAKALAGYAATGSKITAVLGYRDSSTFLADEIGEYARVLIATENGSVGTRGNVLDAVKADGLEVDYICACGPMPMLRAIKKYAEERGIIAYISLEERMACGVGACLGCVVKTTGKDEHSQVNNARICTDGPVFDSRDVDI